MTRVFRVAVVGVVVLAGFGLATDAGGGQTNGQFQDLPQPVPSHQPNTPALGAGMPDGGARERIDEERRKAINDGRHKKLEDDVDKLLSLTNELKTDVDKANKDELSLDVVRKAQEIEKLAHDVQSRMKS